MKAQLSLEILLVLGLIFVFLVPILFYFFYQYGVVSNKISQQYSLQWIENFNKLIENVYYSGPGSLTITDTALPTSVNSIEIKHNQGSYLIYRFQDGTEIVSYFPMDIQLSGTNWRKISNTKLKIENKNGTIVISLA